MSGIRVSCSEVCTDRAWFHLLSATEETRCNSVALGSSRGKPRTSTPSSCSTATAAAGKGKTEARLLSNLTGNDVEDKLLDNFRNIFVHYFHGDAFSKASTAVAVGSISSHTTVGATTVRNERLPR